ncbi:hypothetical protein SLEP1_g42193 [Rubroshorea leprosula]|uniref:Integrase zinc-binding domain-containing protein n=1 Tax=Rubroshorea leprosula TaxID=152421 RepID=A0AAV5L9X3_9ROSI|nr:hypothetical protein SLEP1_g42193 [Rubroshorea leprosula]
MLANIFSVCAKLNPDPIEGGSLYTVLFVSPSAASLISAVTCSEVLLEDEEGEGWVFSVDQMVDEARVHSIGQSNGNHDLAHSVLQLDFNCTNNQAEYEALIIGLKVLVELKLLEEFDDVILRHVTRDLKTEANEMAQIASGLKSPEGVLSRIVVVEKRILPSIHMHDEYCQIMSDVHNGICGAHQVGIKMRWLIRRHGFFWPSILKDCISYAKGCKACQIHGPLQRVPASELHPIVKPWPF